MGGNIAPVESTDIAWITFIRDFPDDSAQPPKTEAQLCFDRKRDPTTRNTLAPILIGFSRIVVIDQCSIPSGGARVLRKVP